MFRLSVRDCRLRLSTNLGLMIVLIVFSTPALAGRVDITDGSTPQANFGSSVITSGPMDSAGGTFVLTLDATVYHSGSIYTYVYDVGHTSPTLLKTLWIDSPDFDLNMDWGIIDSASLVSSLQRVYFSSNLAFLLNLSFTDTVSLYAQSSHSPPDNSVQFLGLDGGFSGIGLTLGPRVTQVPIIPLPRTVWMGLALLVGIGIVHFIRHRTLAYSGPLAG